MRKIKFRFYDKDNKKMDYCDLQNLCEDDIWYDGETGVWDALYDSHHNQEKFVVMQFTGLYDKNGKEIYEGDILEIIVNNNIVKRCIVEFKNGVFGVMFTRTLELTAFTNFYNTTFEVLGNIYYNPELLEVEE